MEDKEAVPTACPNRELEWMISESATVLFKYAPTCSLVEYRMYVAAMVLDRYRTTSLCRTD